MDEDSDDLDLATLAKSAGVTPRAIRYYVSQGLLPSPGTRGPGTKYDRALLDRLQLIKLLQREHWPLAKIREHLESLDEEGVRRELGQPPELPLPASGSALQYVRKVLGRRGEDESLSLGEMGPLFDSARSRAQPPTADTRAQKPDAAPDKWQVTKSTWERIRLARDVELNIRRPLTREQNKQIDRLLEAAREIFSEED